MRTLSTQPAICATPLPPLFFAKAFSFLYLSLAFPGNPSHPYPKPKIPRKSHVMGIQDRTEKEHVTLIFTYGTLKRGFSNHILMQELMRTGDAAFKGTYLTVEKYPLVCGPYRVPFLLNMPGSGNRVMGELYAVSAQGLARLDELEGTTRGHYERLPILVLPAENEDRDFGIDGEISSGCGSGATCAEAYYAHRSYEKEMWRRNEGKGFVTYSEKEAKGYVKRKDRPQNLTFLDHIRIFVSSPSD